LQKIDPVLDSLKSERTKEQYSYHLERYFKSYSAMDASNIIEYLMTMKRESLSYSYRRIALSAIRHHCAMNDILLNWAKIAKFLGENRFDNTIRGYIHTEIRKLLEVANVHYKAIILTLCSTGMRREALVQINPAKDMEVINLDDGSQIYKIMIYRKTKYEQVCFTTPEAAEAIKSYLSITNSTLFHNINAESLSTQLRNLVVRAKILQKKTNVSINGKFRDSIPAVHGLRKFAITQMAKAKVDTEIAKLLTGYSIGVRAKYLNYTDDDLLQEFLKAVDLLTIYEDNRLKKQVAALKEQNKDNEYIIAGKLQEKDKQIFKKRWKRSFN
jgi:integrase